MAKIRIVDGDMELKELSADYRVVVDYNLNDPLALYPFITEPYDGVYHDKVIEASANKVPVEFIKWVIQHSVYPVIIFFNGDKPAGLTKSALKTENEIENIAGAVTKKEALFPMLERILYDANRSEVYDKLKAATHLHFIAFKWLISNINKLDEHNQSVIKAIDETAFLKNNASLIEMLAFSIKPMHHRIRLEWKFPKKDEE